MTKFKNSIWGTKIGGVFKTTGSAMIVIFMMIVLVFGNFNTVYATGETVGIWAVAIGDEDVAYVESEEAGQQIIDEVKKRYQREGSTLIEMKIEPAITVRKVPFGLTYGYKAQSTSSDTVKKTVDEISGNKVEYYTYGVEKGDTLKKLAKENSLSVDRLVNINFDRFTADDELQVGDFIVLYSESPRINVTTVEKYTANERIKYKTVYRETATLKRGVSKVYRKGKYGSKQVVKEVETLNGDETSVKVLSSKVVSKPTSKIVLKGTRNVTAVSGRTYDVVDGDTVVEFAKKYIGNPYVYGGTSLTNGADCSGFVYAVYKALGIDIPRCGQISAGRAVSYSNVKKGDILFYPGHVAIYAGNGTAIHAVNERLGIRITGVNYTGSVYAVRRIVE